MNLHSWQQCFSHSLYQRDDWQQQLPTCQLTSHQIAVEAGVQIYQNHLLVSLTEALQATYPYTRKMIGDACFNAVAKRYIEEHPLTTGDITHYGHGLENTLAQIDTILEAAPFITELAHLECLIDQTLNRLHNTVPVSDDILPLTHLASLQEEQWPCVSLNLHHGITTFYSHFALFSLIDAVEQGGLENVQLQQNEQAIIQVYPDGRWQALRVSSGAIELVEAFDQSLPLKSIDESLLTELDHLLAHNLFVGFTLKQD